MYPYLGCGNSNGGCDQICTQDSTGFTCSCVDGYILGSDRKRCYYAESRLHFVYIW